ncbi:acyl carrier protein [Cumulibacter manganitolerans]|uniref:acyl carrier protein n=1 Tax=Cumulibacter manganitolerans TaxID=1884992 RepID=UPI00129526F0|nr:phosphopantetheine-binding protein [Cumulibacter manganitolerans]
MDEADLRAVVLRSLGEIAPEADLAGLDHRGDLREELELDSLDILNLAIRLYEATGIDVPERDYAKIVTVDGCVDYLGGRLEGRAG